MMYRSAPGLVSEHQFKQAPKSVPNVPHSPAATGTTTIVAKKDAASANFIVTGFNSVKLKNKLNGSTEFQQSLERK